MKTEIIKIKHVNPIQEKFSRLYLKYDACVKITGPEICSENKIRESIVKTLFKNTMAVAVLCSYIMMLLQDFVNKCLRKKMFQRAC